jgi:hypothetical protein
MSTDPHDGEVEGQPTPSTEALLEQGKRQLARSRRLLNEIDAMVRPSAPWPSAGTDTQRDEPAG